MKLGSSARRLRSRPELISSGRSPFSAMAAIGYYDGPLSGVCQWSKEDRAIFFRVIAWEAHRDERLFAAFEIARRWIERLRPRTTKMLTEPDMPTIDLLRRELGHPSFALITSAITKRVDVYRLDMGQVQMLERAFDLTDPFGHGSPDLREWLSRLGIAGEPQGPRRSASKKRSER